jgi:type II secretory pathway component PulJ
MGRESVLSERGMSLVEPLVAMVVLSLSLLGSVSMLAVAQDGIAGGARKLEAIALAESRMERLRAVPYQSLLKADLDGEGLVAGRLKDSGSEGVAVDGEYTARQTINEVMVTWTVRPDRPSLSNSRMVTMTVTAAWSDRGGRPRTVRLGMRRANPVFSAGAV